MDDFETTMLEFDLLMAALHEAVWEAASGVTPVDFDLAGVEQEKALTAWVRAALSHALPARVPDASPADKDAGLVADGCLWTQDSDFEMGDTYDSGCGEKWSFIDGGPKENNVRFCQGCGKPVKLGGV